MSRAKKAVTETYRTTDGRLFDVRDPYYLASCDACGWVGSSEECGTDYGPWGDSDVYCPKCNESGADCGRVGAAAEVIEASQ